VPPFHCEHGSVPLYRPLFLSPRQATLLGVLWIAVRWNQEKGEGAFVESGLLENLIFSAQSRGLIMFPSHFRFEASFPEPVSAGLRVALEELARQGFLHLPETGGTVGFLGTSYVDLPTGIFRQIDFFGFTELAAALLKIPEPPLLPENGSSRAEGFSSEPE